MSLRKIVLANQFKRDMKKKPLELLFSSEWLETIDCLRNGKNLPKERKDHELKGDWLGFRECHIKPDLLLIYDDREEVIILTRIGTHSELFG